MDSFFTEIGDLMVNQSKTRKKDAIHEIKTLYTPVKPEIKSRLKEFKLIWKKGDDKDIFSELVFCLLTPQSKAKSCDAAMGCLLEMDLLLKGNEKQIAKELRGKVRFHNAKAKNIVLARKTFTKRGKLSIKKIIPQFTDSKDARDWLIKNVRGLGCKEASHFLRNIGHGENLAILDRHILRNLIHLGIIGDIPSSLTNKKYLEIEQNMTIFADKIGIPLAHLDLLLWYKETGEIFK